ncbi:MAG TPA: DinB family protein [Acidobacteriota bacterium]|nr:DinB family protein [Acidobacteriota bacterium]
MTETAQQYSDRILGNLGKRDPIEVLESTIARMEALGRAIRNSDSKSQSGRWSARQLLTHFAEGEIVFAYRLRAILSASGSSIQAYDQDAWVGKAGYLERDAALALELFKAVRSANLAFLRNLKKEEWQYFGMHSERGKETIEQMVNLMAGHDLNHLRQLEELSKN